MYYQHRHEIDTNPETNEKLASIIASLESNGWQGRPVLVQGNTAYTGCHRLTACEILGVTPETHEIEITAQWGRDDYLLDWFCGAVDDDDLLNAMDALLEDGLIDQTSVEIMWQETKNR